jgi:tRNA (mo5U34)-methyltransferase
VSNETSAAVDDVATAIAANPAWYHTIELPGGAVTPGYVDWRRDAPKILPADLHGIRALDVGTYDGFWAFELEHRGAEVTAIDLESLDASSWPPIHRAKLLADTQAFGLELGRGFRIAKQLRGSSVTRIACDVIELTPEAVGGAHFELAFVGALLLHLRDPIRALENIRNVLVPGGRLVMVEAISMTDTLLHPRAPVARFDTARNPINWWLPNVRALRDYMWAAGFVEGHTLRRPLRPPAKPAMRCWYAALEARAPAAD